MPQIPKPRGPKFTPTEREEVMHKVALLDKKGWIQADIAREVGVDQSQVSWYLKNIRKRYIDSTNWSKDQEIAGILIKLQNVMTEAYNAWDQSKEDKQKIINEEITSSNAIGAFTRNKVAEEKERQTGQPSYLSIILDCIKQIRQIKGLDAPTKVNATVNNINWDLMSKEDTRSKADNVEQLINNALIVDAVESNDSNESLSKQIEEGDSSNGNITDGEDAGYEVNGEPEGDN